MSSKTSVESLRSLVRQPRKGSTKCPSLSVVSAPRVAWSTIIYR